MSLGPWGTPLERGYGSKAVKNPFQQHLGTIQSFVPTGLIHANSVLSIMIARGPKKPKPRPDLVVCVAY